MGIGVYEENNVKTTRTILALGAVVSAVMLVGCTHTVEVLVQNPSAKALVVKATGPAFEAKALGTVAAKGGTLKGEVDIPSKELPTDLILHVGDQTLTYEITENVPKIWAFISLENNKLMKRTGKDPVTEEKKTDIKKPIGEPESIIE